MKFNLLILLLLLIQGVAAQELAPIQVRDEQIETDTTAHQVQKLNQYANFYNLAEQLNILSGVKSTQFAAPGVKEVLSIRARTGSNVLVYIEDMAINQINDFEVDLSNFSDLFFSEVRVYSSNTPFELGAGKGGGAIQFKVDQSQAHKFKTNLSHASFNHHTIHSVYAGEDVMVGVNYESAANDFSFKNDNGTPLNSNDDFIDKRKNANYSKLNLMFCKNNRWQKIKMSNLILYNKKDQGLPDDLNSSSNNSQLRSQSLQLFNQVKWLSFSNQIGFSLSHQLFDDEQASLGLGQKKNEYQTRQLWNQLNYNYEITPNTQIKFLGLIAKSNLEDHDKVLNKDFNRHSNEIQLGSSFSYFYSTHVLSIEMTQRQIDYLNQYKYSRDNLTVSNLFTISSQTDLDIRVSKEYRLPSLNELFVNTGVMSRNSELRAEQTEMAEVSLRFNGERMQFNTSVYKAIFRDKIVWVFDSRGIGKPVNIESAQNHGIEVSMSYRWSKLFANINLSSQKPVNRSTDKYLAGEFLTSSSFEFGVKQDRLLMSLIYQHANTIYFDSTNLRQGADFKTLDFTSSYQLANSTRIFFGLKNLLNNQNQLNNGFPAPLRQFFTSVNFTY